MKHARSHGSHTIREDAAKAFFVKIQHLLPTNYVKTALALDMPLHEANLWLNTLVHFGLCRVENGRFVATNESPEPNPTAT